MGKREGIVQEVLSWWQSGDSIRGKLSCGHTVEITPWFPSLFVSCVECRNEAESKKLILK